MRNVKKAANGGLSKLLFTKFTTAITRFLCHYIIQLERTSDKNDNSQTVFFCFCGCLSKCLIGCDQLISFKSNCVALWFFSIAFVIKSQDKQGLVEFILTLQKSIIHKKGYVVNLFAFCWVRLVHPLLYLQALLLILALLFQNIVI